MGALVQISQDLLTAVERVSSRRGQPLEAFIEEALREALAPARFTTREQQILTLLSEGYSLREIAARCEISNHTVRAYLGDILEKLKAMAITAEARNEVVKEDAPRFRDRQRIDLPTFRGEGLKPGANLDDSAALLDLMESSSHAPD